MNPIYHITTIAHWSKFKNQEHYFSPTFDQENFIHLSEKHQLQGVLERYYKNQSDILILTINPDLLTSVLKYESATNAELFPHCYGPINISAIINVEKI